jgi:hypothetical protein
VQFEPSAEAGHGAAPPADARREAETTRGGEG